MDNQIQIFDDYLNETDFKKIRDMLLTPYNFPYYFNDCKVFEGDNDPQFTHIFYNYHNINSDFYSELNCIIEKINPVSLMKIKANLQLKDTEIRTTAMHKDYSNPLDNQKTGILYMNTNNGKTIFEDGEEVDSVENRLILFDSLEPHYSTSTSNAQARLNININYV